MSRRVLVVGLGTIARTHLAVLAARDDVEVIGGVDPRPVDRLDVPVLPSLEAGLAEGPDVVVVATPTDTHAEVVGAVLAGSDALVLSEKPLVRTRAALRDLEDAHGDALGRVRVAHHFAYSPEVAWALSRVRSDWGAPRRILSVFNDAYAAKTPEQLASYVSTWVDSGPNQLSMLAPFVSGWRLTGHADEGRRAVTTLAHDGGTTLLTSSWLAADSSKQTTVEYDDVLVRMDHTSMTGVVVAGAEVVEHAAYSGGSGRKEAHYAGLYEGLFAHPDDPRLGVPLAARVAELLEEATGHEGRVAFTEVG